MRRDFFNHILSHIAYYRFKCLYEEIFHSLLIIWYLTSPEHFFTFSFFFLQQFLKEILNELCVYNKRGQNQGTYELKPEYKKSVEDTGSD